MPREILAGRADVVNHSKGGPPEPRLRILGVPSSSGVGLVSLACRFRSVASVSFLVFVGPESSSSTSVSVSEPDILSSKSVTGGQP